MKDAKIRNMKKRAYKEYMLNEENIQKRRKRNIKK
jgi:hypothetical protein